MSSVESILIKGKKYIGIMIAMSIATYLISLLINRFELLTLSMIYWVANSVFAVVMLILVSKIYKVLADLQVEGRGLLLATAIIYLVMAVIGIFIWVIPVITGSMAINKLTQAEKMVRFTEISNQMRSESQNTQHTNDALVNQQQTQQGHGFPVEQEASNPDQLQEENESQNQNFPEL